MRYFVTWTDRDLEGNAEFVEADTPEDAVARVSPGHVTGLIYMVVGNDPIAPIGRYVMVTGTARRVPVRQDARRASKAAPRFIPAEYRTAEASRRRQAQFRI